MFYDLSDIETMQSIHGANRTRMNSRVHSIVVNGYCVSCPQYFFFSVNLFSIGIDLTRIDCINAICQQTSIVDR
jgi:hypothetical protein